MIETEDLGRRFGALVAVEGVSLRVAAGEVVALLGPNGAGKTTTMQMIAALLAPSRGTARVAGYDVPIPPALLEDYYLPTPARVVEAVRTTMTY